MHITKKVYAKHSKIYINVYKQKKRLQTFLFLSKFVASVYALMQKAIASTRLQNLRTLYWKYIFFLCTTKFYVY